MKYFTLGLMISSVSILSYGADKHILDDPFQVHQNKEHRAIHEANTHMQRAEPVPERVLKNLNPANRTYAERYNQALKVSKKFL